MGKNNLPVLTAERHLPPGGVEDSARDGLELLLGQFLGSPDSFGQSHEVVFGESQAQRLGIGDVGWNVLEANLLRLFPEIGLLYTPLPYSLRSARLIRYLRDSYRSLSQYTRATFCDRAIRRFHAKLRVSDQ